MDGEKDDDLERAQQWAVRPPPLAPYWEGRTFDEALETPMEALHAEADNSALYERLFALINEDDPVLNDQALSQIKYALRAEARDEEERHAADQPVDPSLLHFRLGGILAAVEHRLTSRPELLEAFCYYFYRHRDEPQTGQIRNWLNSLDASLDAGRLSRDSLLAARILFGAYGATWGEAGTRLLETLDHEDLTVRACAAYQIGKFCRRLAPASEEHDSWRRNLEEDQRITQGMAALTHYWDLIRSKEIQRAGVAGAFWNSAPTWTIDADDWLLTLLEQAEREPYLRYFPCNLGFDAHERFSSNPVAIQRLIDAGRIDLALEAATEENDPVPGLEPILMELGENEDMEIVRRASWTLAYAYNRLHPNGARLGFVQRQLTHPHYDLFLLFTGDRQPGLPYAVVLYPKIPCQYWSLKKAEDLVHQIFPPTVRGEASRDSPTDWPSRWYERGYVSFAVTGKQRNTKRVSRITIGYRSDIYWNPSHSPAVVRL